MLLVKGNHFLKGKVAYNVAIKDKEGLAVLGQDGLCQRKGAGRPQGLAFDAKGDAHAKLLLVLLHGGLHDFGAVVDGENDILDAGLQADRGKWAVSVQAGSGPAQYLGQVFDLMHNHGLVGKGDKRLWEGKG